MKTYNISNRLSKPARECIENIIETHNKYKNSYFWKSGSSSSNRRYNEANFLNNNPDVCFINDQDTIKVSSSYSESCNNCYYSISILVNSESKNITTLKKLLK